MVDGGRQFHGSSACNSWFLVLPETIRCKTSVSQASGSMPFRKQPRPIHSLVSLMVDAGADRLAGRPTWAHDPTLMADEKKSLWTGVKRGLARRCPNCGKGQLLRGY